MLWLIQKLLFSARGKKEEHSKEAKTPAEQYVRLNDILQNIESYNGTGEGQKYI